MMSGYIAFLREEAGLARDQFKDGIAETFDAVANELTRLQAIVEKLPETADGVKIVPDMEVWAFAAGVHKATVKRIWGINKNGKYQLILQQSRTLSYARFARQCYSTREAALAAREGK